MDEDEMSEEKEKGPPRGAKHWSIYCPECERYGVMAGWTYAVTGKEVPPEELTCPECGAKVEVIGRVDQ